MWSRNAPGKESWGQKFKGPNLCLDIRRQLVTQGSLALWLAAYMYGAFDAAIVASLITSATKKLETKDGAGAKQSELTNREPGVRNKILMW